MWSDIGFIFNIQAIIGMPVTAYFVWKELTKN